MTSAFPGFESPAVGFEQPFEMLEACHERVRRSLVLLGRLIVHIGNRGHDVQSRSAASDVLRYFDLAAPLHHQDEELHVFALLAATGDAGSQSVIEALLGDHVRLEALWGGLRETLAAWSRPDATGLVDAVVRQHAHEFERLHVAHLQTEERIVFPAARARMDAAGLAAMSLDMQLRRRSAASP